jgi:iron(III)-enterobactin esterase
MIKPEEVALTSKRGRERRTVWFVDGPETSAHPLCVFLDGEHYLKNLEALATLDTLMASQLVPRMSLAFVSNVDDAARHEDYTCNDAYAAMVGEELVPWARRRRPSIQETDNVLCGVSLSGLAAAHISLRYPEIFPLVLAQSGSFWWNDLRFAGLVRESPSCGRRYWLSVGDLETDTGVTHPPSGIYQAVSQIVGVESAVEALGAAGADVHLHRFHGGHAFAPWRSELGEAVAWLLRGQPD